MSYALVGEVRTVFGNKLPKTYTDEQVLSHIEKAEAYIDSKLAKVYDTPFKGEAPTLIKHIAVDLAVSYIEFDLYSSQQPNLNETTEKRYQRALDMLNALVEGTLDLGIPRKDGAQSAGFGTTNESEPIFTLELPQW